MHVNYNHMLSSDDEARVLWFRPQSVHSWPSSAEQLIGHSDQRRSYQVYLAKVQRTSASSRARNVPRFVVLISPFFAGLPVRSTLQDPISATATQSSTLCTYGGRSRSCSPCAGAALESVEADSPDDMLIGSTTVKSLPRPGNLTCKRTVY